MLLVSVCCSQQSHTSLALRALCNVTEGMCDAKVGVAVPTLCARGAVPPPPPGAAVVEAGAVSGRRTSRRRPAHSAAQYSTGRAWPRYLLESPRRTATAHCSHAAGCDEPPLFPEVISHASPLQARFRRRASAGGGKLRLFRGAPDLYSGSRAEHRALGQPQAPRRVRGERHRHETPMRPAAAPLAQLHDTARH